MKRSIIALGCLLLAGPAFAQSVGEKSGVSSTLGIAPTTAYFVKEVAISDMIEIRSNQLGQETPRKSRLRRKWSSITPRPAPNESP